MSELRRIDALIVKLEASLVKTNISRKLLLHEASEVKEELDILSARLRTTSPANRKDLKLSIRRLRVKLNRLTGE
jgi:hypothetical protein